MPDSDSPQPGTDRDYLAEWLGIGPDQRPASLYALCGAADLAEDTDQIQRGAREHIKKLRAFASHPVHGPAASQLLDKVSGAMLVLTDAARKGQYDVRLRARKLHAISLLGRKLLAGEQERLAQFIDGAYTAGGTFPVREIEKAIVDTYHRCRGQRFTFARLARYLRSPAWHAQAHLLARLDQKISQRQREGERFRQKRLEVMAEGKQLGLSPAQSLAVWANRVQYELALDRQLRAWGLGPDGQPLGGAGRRRGLGPWPWVAVGNATIACIFFLVAFVLASGPKHGEPRTPRPPDGPAPRERARTWVHAPQLLYGQAFGKLASRFEAESAEARKAGYLRLAYLAAAGDEEVIALLNGLIRREIDPAVRAFALLVLARRRAPPQAARLCRAFLPLAADANIGSVAGRWMYRQVTGSVAPEAWEPEKVLAVLFRRLDRPASGPNVVRIWREDFQRFWKGIEKPDGDEFAEAPDTRRRAGAWPRAGRIAEMVPVTDGLLRASLLPGPARDAGHKLTLALRMPSTLGRQWLLDDVKKAAGFDAATALQKYFDDLDNDSQRRPVIAAAQYLALFEESMARRILLLLRRTASGKTEDAPLLFGSAAEYLNAASGRGETFDAASPSDRWTAVTRFSEWFKNHYGSPP